jgi:hypothetical protein
LGVMPEDANRVSRASDNARQRVNMDSAPFHYQAGKFCAYLFLICSISYLTFR